MKKITLILLALLGISAMAEELLRPPNISNLRKIIFVGDSITHGGFYHAYFQIELALRFPEKRQYAVNKGLSGNTSAQLRKQLHKIVLQEKPDTVFVMVGINDLIFSGETFSDKKMPSVENIVENVPLFKQYCQNMRDICAILKAEKINTILLTPAPYDQYGQNGGKVIRNLDDGGVVFLSAIVKKIGAENNLPVIDLYSPMREILVKNPLDDLRGKDRIHPARTEHLMMAALICNALKGQNLRRPLQNNASGVKLETEDAEVSDASFGKESLKFRFTPSRLPFPRTDTWRNAQKYMDVSSAFHSGRFFVTGLTNGKYRLFINGNQAGEYTEKELSLGVEPALHVPALVKQGEAMNEAMESYRSAFAALQTLELTAMRIPEGMTDENEIRNFLNAFLDKLKRPNPYEFHKREVENYFRRNELIPNLLEKARRAHEAMYRKYEIQPIYVEVRKSVPTAGK